MTEKQKADTLRNELLVHIVSWDIAGFLQDETSLFLRSLNSWKLEKIQCNFSLFKRFLYLLDDQNTKQLHASLVDPYYMSKRGKLSHAKKKISLTTLPLTQSRIIQVASKIKAMFVFQAVEFCNGSMDRMKVIDFSKIRISIVHKCKEFKK